MRYKSVRHNNIVKNDSQFVCKPMCDAGVFHPEGQKISYCSFRNLEETLISRYSVQQNCNSRHTLSDIKRQIGTDTEMIEFSASDSR